MTSVALNDAPRIDASLGAGMVGGAKALYAVILALLLGMTSISVSIF